jgi:hypothetical protein
VTRQVKDRQAGNVLQSTKQQFNRYAVMLASMRPKGGERRSVTCATCVTVAAGDHKYQKSK